MVRLVQMNSCFLGFLGFMVSLSLGSLASMVKCYRAAPGSGPTLLGSSIGPVNLEGKHAFHQCPSQRRRNPPAPTKRDYRKRRGSFVGFPVEVVKSSELSDS